MEMICAVMSCVVGEFNLNNVSNSFEKVTKTGSRDGRLCFESHPGFADAVTSLIPFHRGEQGHKRGPNRLSFSLIVRRRDKKEENQEPSPEYCPVTVTDTIRNSSAHRHSSHR